MTDDTMYKSATSSIEKENGRFSFANDTTKVGQADASRLQVPADPQSTPPRKQAEFPEFQSSNVKEKEESDEENVLDSAVVQPDNLDIFDRQETEEHQ